MLVDINLLASKAVHALGWSLWHGQLPWPSKLMSTSIAHNPFLCGTIILHYRIPSSRFLVMSTCSSLGVICSRSNPADPKRSFSIPSGCCSCSGCVCCSDCCCSLVQERIFIILGSLKELLWCMVIVDELLRAAASCDLVRLSRLPEELLLRDSRIWCKG